MNANVSFWLRGEKYNCGDIVMMSEVVDKKTGGNRIAKYNGLNLGNYSFSIIAPNTPFDKTEIIVKDSFKHLFVLGKYNPESLVETTSVVVEELRDPKHIDGIVEAWAWYIFIMLFAIIFVFPWNIVTWWVATVVFFTWRNRKMHWR